MGQKFSPAGKQRHVGLMLGYRRARAVTRHRGTLPAPGNRRWAGGKLLATFLQRPRARGGGGDKIKSKQGKRANKKQIKGTFQQISHVSGSLERKQRSPSASLRVPTRRPQLGSPLPPPPPRGSPSGNRCALPNGRPAGRPPDTGPSEVPGAARSGGGTGRAHPGHQRALQEHLHELRHRHVHAEPRPRRTKRLWQPAAGAGDKGGARAHGARLRPRPPSPPGASERVGARGGREGGRGDAVPSSAAGLPALPSGAEPSGAGSVWGARRGERGGATARGGPSARAGAACARRPGRGVGPGGRGARC